MIITQAEVMQRIKNNCKWKYIEYSLYNSKHTYYNLRKILSFNLPINIIIGARGMGKSFAVKKQILSEYLNNPVHSFVWVRETADAVSMLTKNGGIKFTEDIPLMRLDIEDINVNRGVCKINKNFAGEFMSASTYQKFKGGSYVKSQNLVIDEFIPEKTTVKKITPEAIINTMSTVVRSRDNGRIYMMANAIDRADPFLDSLGLELGDFGFYVNRAAGVVLHYADNSADFNAMNSQGIVGRLMLNTKMNHYADNIMFAKFNDDSTLIFEKMPSKCKLFIILETPLQQARIYQGDGHLWVTPDVDADMYLHKRYVINTMDAKIFKPVLPLLIKKKLKENLQNNNFRFQSNFLKKFINDVLK